MLRARLFGRGPRHGENKRTRFLVSMVVWAPAVSALLFVVIVAV